MTFIRIKRGDISKMNMDELRVLKTKWDKVNKLACNICTVFIYPIAFVAISGATNFIIQLFGFTSHYGMFRNIFPVLVTVGLVFCLVRMKYENIKGYIGTIAIYLMLGIAFSAIDNFIYKLLYQILFVVSFIPAFFVLRCIINYDMLKKMREMPGYPFFIYTVAEKFANQVYLQDKPFSELEPVSQEEYVPWNAFDENGDENTKDNKDI